MATWDMEIWNTSDIECTETDSEATKVNQSEARIKLTSRSNHIENDNKALTTVNVSTMDWGNYSESDSEAHSLCSSQTFVNKNEKREMNVKTCNNNLINSGSGSDDGDCVASSRQLNPEKTVHIEKWDCENEGEGIEQLIKKKMIHMSRKQAVKVCSSKSANSGLSGAFCGNIPGIMKKNRKKDKQVKKHEDGSEDSDTDFAGYPVHPPEPKISSASMASLTCTERSLLRSCNRRYNHGNAGTFEDGGPLSTSNSGNRNFADATAKLQSGLYNNAMWKPSHYGKVRNSTWFNNMENKLGTDVDKTKKAYGRQFNTNSNAVAFLAATVLSIIEKCAPFPVPFRLIPGLVDDFCGRAINPQEDPEFNVSWVDLLSVLSNCICTWTAGDGELLLGLKNMIGPHA